jgi:hypothetical protein
MAISSVCRVLIVAAAAVLVGCASTTLEGSWTRPGFGGKQLDGAVLVAGITRDETMRRVFEDDMAAKLSARGVKTTASYTVVPSKLGPDDFEKLVDAARKSGARYLLSTALIGQGREVVVTQDPMWGAGYGYRGWYGRYWGPAYTDVRTYNVYNAQTSLTEVDSDRIEWTARTRTSEPSDIEKEVRAFVDVILDAMGKAQLLGTAG